MNSLKFDVFIGLNDHFIHSLPEPDINVAEFLNFTHVLEI